MKLKKIIAAGVAAATLASGLAVNAAAANAVEAVTTEITDGTYYIQSVLTKYFLAYDPKTEGIIQTRDKQASALWIIEEKENGDIVIAPASEPGYGLSVLNANNEAEVFLSSGENTNIRWKARKESGHMAILPDGTNQGAGNPDPYALAATDNRNAKIATERVRPGENGYDIRFQWDFIRVPTSDAPAGPTASPKPGTVAAGTNVTLATATSGAKIYYTDDGSNPAAYGKQYAGPIRIDSRTVIRAYAVGPNNKESKYVEFIYEVSGMAQKTAAPTSNVPQGDVNANTGVRLASSTNGAVIYYTTDGSDPVSSKTRIRYTSPIVVSAGAYMAIKAMASAPGFADSEVSTFEYNKSKNAAPAPVPNPAGGQFNYGQAVTLSASGNARNTVIYYTLDGSDPATSKTRVKYAGAFAINQTAVLKAYTEAQGMANSQVVTYNFTIGPVPNMIINLTIGKLNYTKNGTTAYFDVAPYIEPSSGRTMVPIRFIAEALDANVEWDNATSTDTITTLNGRTLKIVLNQQLPDGMGMAVLKQDRLFVPVRYVAEQLGAEVKWDDASKTVTITSK